ncbi:hypothetical protein OG21DRAFT_1514124 [Imleria badia]|nr:hypothetical protein OG21DRAFT_1514124 [Imleria badia]
MLLTWLISGRLKYISTQVAVVYISDIGASFLKPLFIVACCVTGPGLLISLTIERLLRHKGRLPPDLHTCERIFGRLAIVGAFIAMWGLALLSGFDVGRHPTEHMIFLLVFIIGVSLSAIFTVIEFRWLAQDYAEIDKLKRAYIAKAVIGLTLVVLAIVFGVTLFYAPDVGGVVEWLIAFGFSFYLLTFVYDLRMARVRVGEVSEEGMVEIH